MHQFKVGDEVILKGGLRPPLRYNEDLFEYMGTVQKVIDVDHTTYGPRIKLAGCTNNNRRNIILFWEEDLLPVPEIGDKVKIRSWEDMRDQYGLDDDGDIKCKYFFTKNMKGYEGCIFTVDFVDSDSFRISGANYCFSFECIEKVYKKAEFTKKDLRNGMTVKAGGNVYMVHEGRLLGTNGWLDLNRYRDDLIYDGDPIWDIQDVCDVSTKGQTRIYDILTQRGPQLWPKKVKEVSVSEALDILGEKFGCAVKIVEDNQNGGK